MRKNAQTFGWFVFLVLIKNYSASTTPFELQPTELSAKEGCCAEITCTRTRSVDVEHWFWIKDKTWDNQISDFTGTIVYSSNNSIRAVSPEFVGRVQVIGLSHQQKILEPVWSILICNLTKNDSGNYSFRFVGKKLKWVKDVNLKVEENPCLLTFHQPPTLNGSGTIALTCSTLSSCSLNPEIQNLLPSSTTQLIGGKSTTASFEANATDDGKVFSCQIQKNMDKYCIQNISITVEYGPRDLVAQVSKTESVREGDLLSFTCSAKGNPQPTISWFEDDNKVSTGPEWSIDSIQESQSGQYHCEAKNKYGGVKSESVNIAVTYAPQVEIRKTSPMSFVTEGDEMILTCDLKRSSPPPEEYYWWKDKYKLKVGRDNTLRIVKIKPEDSGNYTCKAKNDVDYGESGPLEISVRYRPRKTHISISGPVNYGVKVGSNIQLICISEANPSPHNYSWYRYNNNKPTDSSWWQSRTVDEERLNFIKVERSDEACYMCNATNSIGTGENSDEKCINVLYPPTVPELLMPGEVTEGETITITCTVESNPVSVFTLRRDGQKIHQSDDYLLESNTLRYTFNVTSERRGSYTCSAENSEGSALSKETNLVVKYTPKDVMVKPRDGFEVNETKSLKLDCNFKSHPLATFFIWIKMIDGKDKTMTKSKTLTINSVSPSDSGIYRCEATNDVGTGKSQPAEVKVRYAPKHTTILRTEEKQGRNGGSYINLTCSSNAYPQLNYIWKLKGKESDTIVSEHQNHTVESKDPGAYYCIAKNYMGQKFSEPVNLFEQNIAMIVIVFVCLLILLIILLLLLFYRRKKSFQRRSTNLQSSFDFLVWWRSIGGGSLRNETVLAEPFRSRDDLLPEQPFRLNAQRCQARPDSTPASNINTVYSTVNLPAGKPADVSFSGQAVTFPSVSYSNTLTVCPTPAAQKHTGWQGGHTQDESLNYASLDFGNKPKTKQAKGEEDVYAKVSKPNPLQKNEEERLGDYENVRIAHASKFPNPMFDYDDSSSSDDEADVSDPRVTFTPKPGCQKDDTDSSTSDDDEIQYLGNKVNEGDVNYSQVTFKPKPGHRRDNKDSSTSDDDEIQYSDVKL